LAVCLDEIRGTQNEQQAAVQAAQARGARFGRRPLLNDEQMAIAKQVAAAGAATKDIAGAFGVSSATVLKWKKKWRAADGAEDGNPA
jgi:transposase-like protein